MNANAKQVNGTHYQTGSLQHWDYVVQALKSRYFEGNISKYVARYKKKHMEIDVNKALHYADKLLELYDLGMVTPMMDDEDHAVYETVEQFCTLAGMDYHQRRVLYRCATWRNRADLVELRACVHTILEEAFASSPDRHYVDQS